MVFKKISAPTNTILKCLSNNGVLIMPCDTIYGIVCNSGPAEERIRDIKGRDNDKPFINLIPSSDYVSRLSGDKIDNTILSLWPGPLTLVLNSLSGGTVALRVPEDDFLRKILGLTGVPMVSTSVNRSGNPPLNSISDIISAFEKDVDMIIDGGDLLHSVPSTIVDMTVKPHKILRQGKCVFPDFFLR